MWGWGGTPHPSFPSPFLLFLNNPSLFCLFSGSLCFWSQLAAGAPENVWQEFFPHFVCAGGYPYYLGTKFGIHPYLWGPIGTYGVLS